MTDYKRATWFLWTFQALRKLIALILGLTGRLVVSIMGIIILGIDLLLSLTVIGAFDGIPLGLIGILLIIGSIY